MKTKIITTILTVCMMLSFMITNTASASTSEPSASVEWTDKIDAAVWDMAQDNKKHLVYISRELVPYEEIEREFNMRNEYPLAYYKDKATYRWEIGSKVAMEAFLKYGMQKTFDIETGRELFKDEIAPIQYELIQDYNDYIKNKREVVTDLYEDYNHVFSTQHDISNNLIVYEGCFTGDYIIYANLEEIISFAQDESVDRIAKWDDVIPEPSMDISETQIQADSNSGTKSSVYNHSTKEIGYRGTGIKIGILEARSGTYNSYAHQLRGIHNKSLTKVPCIDFDEDGKEIVIDPNSSSLTSDHATLVTSIIVGQPIEVDDVIFEGVVPNATVYQMPINTASGVLYGIDKLVSDYGVTVINYSGGNIEGWNDTTQTMSGMTYGDMAKCYDKAIHSSGVSFVCAAGNPLQYVAAPAICYNSIAVGAVMTKSDTSSAIPESLMPYHVVGSTSGSTIQAGSCSAYDEMEGLTNKPDIVAPGTYISYVNEYGNIEGMSGNSFSAPFVTGVIAQMFQADETLMDSPTRTKAVLLAGADWTAVSNVNNPEAFSGSTLIREKSGVGMVNAVNAVEIAQDSNHYNTTFDLSNSSLARLHNLTSVTLTKGQTIRIVLTYNKPEDVTVTTSGYRNDAGLRLYKGTSIVASSSFICSNVEVIEYTAESTWTYNIKAYIEKHALSSTYVTWSVAVAWDIVERS